MTEKMEERARAKVLQICRLYHGEHEGECGISRSIVKALLDFHAQESKELVRAFDQLVNPYVRRHCTHGILLDPVWYQGAQEALAQYQEALKPHSDTK